MVDPECGFRPYCAGCNENVTGYERDKPAGKCHLDLRPWDGVGKAPGLRIKWPVLKKSCILEFHLDWKTVCSRLVRF